MLAPIRPEHVKRISFATKLYPKLRSTLGVDTSKLKTTDHYDGLRFCAGRSKNKDLLSFFGFIADAQKGTSTFIQLPLFRRSLKKLANLIETELEYVGAHEVLLPTLLPEKLWHKSKRLDRQKDALDYVYSFTDRNDNKLLLGPTFEESITLLVNDLGQMTEADLPLLLYQTSQKFRFEPNPKFGLLRSNEFLMSDLYSFDATLDRAKQTYDMITRVYLKIFKRLGLECHRFESSVGNVGGIYSHEYQLPVSSGEDTLIRCNSCQHSYNSEMCSEKGHDFNGNKCLRCGNTNIEKVQALELGHTFLLSDTYSNPLNVYISREDSTKAHYQMGCYGLGLTRILGAGLDLYSIVPKLDASEGQNIVQMRWPNEVEPYKVGLVTPAKRSKQYHGGSAEFASELIRQILDKTRDCDILVEDRDKEGIGRRILRLKSLGLPYIIAVGQRFLQETPEVEVLKLDPEKTSYESLWLTKDQLVDFLTKLDSPDSL